MHITFLFYGGRQHSPTRVKSSPVRNYSPSQNIVTTPGYVQSPNSVHRSSSRDAYYTPPFSPMNVSVSSIITDVIDFKT